MAASIYNARDIRSKLADPEYARGFGEEYAKTLFGVLLAKARTARQMSQMELAQRAGVGQSYIAKLESGEANPTVGKIGQIMGILGCRLAVDALEWETDEVGSLIAVQLGRPSRRSRVSEAQVR